MPTIPALLRSADSALRERIVHRLPEHKLRALERAFGEWAHDGQMAPFATPAGLDWRTWVLMAGRGFGKTRAGAEWVLDAVRFPSRLREGLGEGVFGNRGKQALPRPLPQAGGENAGLRVALVAATIDEARAVMVEGASGILACARSEEIAEWCPGKRRLRFRNGAEATLFSGASPQALRGPQHHLAWCDELAKWRHPQATWDMLQLGLRCGPLPRALVTTTPSGGCAALGGILTAPDTVQTGGGTYDNPHLPAAFIEAVEARYAGTRMGREELDGVFLADVAGTLWPAELLEASRGAPPPADTLRRVVVGVDPPGSALGTCGIVVCGLDHEGVAHVLADRSAAGLSPEGWARAVAAAGEVHGADLSARYDALTQTLGAGGYADAALPLRAEVSEGRLEFNRRVDAAVTARRLTRAAGTRLKNDYYAAVRVEAGYLRDGVLTEAERDDLDSRLDALDLRVGDVAYTAATLTPRARLDAIARAVPTSGLGVAARTQLLVEHGDLLRLEAAYARLTPTAEERAYLERRLTELEVRARIRR